MRHIPISLALLAALGATCLRAEQDPQQLLFRSRTSVVPVYVTVTGPDRRLVADLEQSDFEVLDDGQPRPISIFQNEVLPVTVIVMLDTSASMTGSLKLVRAAAEQFLIRLLPGDRAALGEFNDKITLRGSFTSDRDALLVQLRDLDFGNTTRLYDALARCLDEFRGTQGRKVILVMTDGDDTGSAIRLGAVLDRARREEVMVYAIGLENEYFRGTRLMRTKPDAGLKKLAQETGGGYFQLREQETLGRTFMQVAKELHSQYVLGFTPTEWDGRTHTLSVRINRPGMQGRTRRSYIAERPRGVSAGMTTSQ